MGTKTGQCLCGGVRFTARDVQHHFHACHCGMCRRWSGGGPFRLTEAEVMAAFEAPKG